MALIPGRSTSGPAILATVPWSTSVYSEKALRLAPKIGCDRAEGKLLEAIAAAAMEGARTTDEVAWRFNRDPRAARFTATQGMAPPTLYVWKNLPRASSPPRKTSAFDRPSVLGAAPVSGGRVTPEGLAMDREVEQRIANLNARSIAHVRKAIAIVHGSLEANHRLAGMPDHEATAQSHVIDGEIELDILERELAALEAGDVATARKIAAQFRAERRLP